MKKAFYYNESARRSVFPFFGALISAHILPSHDRVEKIERNWREIEKREKMFRIADQFTGAVCQTQIGTKFALGGGRDRRTGQILRSGDFGRSGRNWEHCQS